MVKCSQCAENIGMLHWRLDLPRWGILAIDGTGVDYMEEDGELPPVNDYTFICPECGNELFHNRRDAAHFLKGDNMNNA